MQDRYVLNATSFLPWFKRKPHFIILSQPAHAYLESGLLSHRESKGFTFIVHTPVNDPSLELDHLVRTPERPMHAHIHHARHCKSGLFHLP